MSIRPLTSSALIIAGVGALVLSAPLTAHAELTSPPACVESPGGGCQDGPLGNGAGGTTWGPTADLSLYDRVDLMPMVGTAMYHRADGAQPTDADAAAIRSGFSWSSCWVANYGRVVECE